MATIGSRGFASGSYDRGDQWTREETSALLDIWSDNTVQELLGGNLRNSDTYDHIGQQLNQINPNYSRTGAQCRCRIKRLKTEYYKAKRGEKNDFSRSKLPFFDRIDEVLCKKPVPMYLNVTYNANVEEDDEASNQKLNDKVGTEDGRDEDRDGTCATVGHDNGVDIDIADEDAQVFPGAHTSEPGTSESQGTRSSARGVKRHVVVPERLVRNKHQRVLTGSLSKRFPVNGPRFSLSDNLYDPTADNDEDDESCDGRTAATVDGNISIGIPHREETMTSSVTSRDDREMLMKMMDVQVQTMNTINQTMQMLSQTASPQNNNRYINQPTHSQCNHQNDRYCNSSHTNDKVCPNIGHNSSCCYRIRSPQCSIFQQNTPLSSSSTSCCHCACHHQSPVYGWDDWRAKIEARNREYTSMFKSKDFKGMSAIYADDCTVMPPGRPGHKGKEGLAEYLSSIVGQGGLCTLKMNSEACIPAGNDMCVESGNSVAHKEDGSILETGQYVLVWKRIGGVLFIMVDIWNRNN